MAQICLSSVLTTPELSHHHPLLSQQEHPSNIQIQNLRTRSIRRIVKARPPSRSRVRYKNIQLPLALLYLFYQTHNLRFRGNIGGDSGRATFETRQGIEFRDRLVDALWSANLASCDDDFLCACTKKCCRGVKTKSPGPCNCEVSVRFHLFSVFIH